MKSFYFLSFVIAFAFHTSANAWIFGTSKTKDGPPKEYCVSPGWFNSNPYKCMPYDQAEKLGFDYSQVYGASSGTSSTQYVQAQADIDKGKTELAQMQRTMSTLQSKLANTKDRLTNGERFTPAELASMQQLERDLEKDIAAMKPKIDAAKASLSEKEQAAGTGGQITDGAARLEIARKGLLAQVNELETKFNSLEDVFRNTEQELNNTVLEAFVVAKINKLAENLCEANKMCEKDPAGVKKFLMEKVASEKLKSSVRPPAAAALPPAAAAGAPADGRK